MGRNSGGTRGGGGGGLAAKQASFQKTMAGYQEQYKAAQKTYNSIKKQLGSSKVTSVGFYANNVMAKMGLKTPSQIKGEMNDFAKNFNWGGASF